MAGCHLSTRFASTVVSVKLGHPFRCRRLMAPACIALGIALLAAFFYAALLSKVLPPFENQVLLAVQDDRYYCLLVPLIVPVITVAVYLHWLSMKMFKHA